MSTEATPGALGSNDQLGAVSEARKTCRDCKADKPISEFYRRKSGSLFTYCIACHREREKTNRAKPMARAHYNERMRLRDDYHAKGIGDAQDWEDACA